MSSSPLPTDTVLLRLQSHGPPSAAIAQRLASAPMCQDLGARISRFAWNAAYGATYIYLDLPGRIALAQHTLAPLADIVGVAAKATVSRLARMHDLSGASHGQHANFHYVVEMTPEAQWEVELQHWYDSEHLPGLASVPGCVRAQRFWNYDAGPPSLACYDLMEEDTMGSEAWLAIRHTEWSTRMRPHFKDTVRTMCTLLPLPALWVPPQP